MCTVSVISRGLVPDVKATPRADTWSDVTPNLNEMGRNINEVTHNNIYYLPSGPRIDERLGDISNFSTIVRTRYFNNTEVTKSI